MSPKTRARGRAEAPDVPPELTRIPGRRILVVSPVVQIRLGPGDRVLVSPGQKVTAGMPIAERTCDPEFIDVGRLNGATNGNGKGNGEGGWKGSQQERRRPPLPGKWWVGGDDRRGRNASV